MAKAPFVAMLTDLCKEERVSVVADVAGYNRDEALGKLFRMWAWCADRGLEDAPEDCPGYALSDAVVRRFLGPRGVEAVLGDGCDVLALGSRRGDGLIYLRGTSETVGRLRKLRATATAGGVARRDQSERGSDGRFVSETTNGPADLQPVSSQAPASSSEIPQSTVHSPDPDLSYESGRDLVAALPPSAPRPPKQPRTRKASASSIPAGWEPRPQELAQATAQGLSADTEREAFVDHHTAKGSVFVDWHAAFRTWIRNATRFAAGTQNGRRPPRVRTLFEAAMDAASAAEERERAGAQT